MGNVEHTTSCTRMGVQGWLCRVYTNGKLNQEKLATTRQEKLDKLSAEKKANMAAPTTTNKL
jgi:hypothetical protein